MEFFGLIHKRPGYDPFFAENPFSPADELVFMGLVVRKCHFDVTACAEARRLENPSFIEKMCLKLCHFTAQRCFSHKLVPDTCSHKLGAMYIVKRCVRLDRRRATAGLSVSADRANSPALALTQLSCSPFCPHIANWKQNYKNKQIQKIQKYTYMHICKIYK